VCETPQTRCRSDKRAGLGQGPTPLPLPRSHAGSVGRSHLQPVSAPLSKEPVLQAHHRRSSVGVLCASPGTDVEFPFTTGSRSMLAFDNDNSRLLPPQRTQWQRPDSVVNLERDSAAVQHRAVMEVIADLVSEPDQPLGVRAIDRCR